MTLPKIDMAKTGLNICKLRMAAGLSVHDIQVALGLNAAQSVYKWQNGTALPTLDNMIALSALLNVSIYDIICLRDTVS